MFIVGAPRSGTTSMYHYLSEHPEIFMSARKEPHFFGTDLSAPTTNHKLFRKENNYLNLFSKSKDEKIIGEASVYYLYSKKAAKNIYKYNPKSKILIMLRSPVEVIESLYKMNYFSGQEKNTTLKQALVAESKRKKGLGFSKRINFLKESFYYQDLVRYCEQVKRYKQIFNDKAIKIIIFDDFKSNPQKTYVETLKFLGVDDGFKPNFKVHNASSIPRNLFIQNITSSFIIHPLQQTGLLTLIPERFLENVKKSFRKDEKMSFMNEGLRKMLKKKYKPEIKKIEKTINMNLGPWYS